MDSKAEGRRGVFFPLLFKASCCLLSVLQSHGRGSWVPSGPVVYLMGGVFAPAVSSHTTCVESPDFQGRSFLLCPTARLDGPNPIQTLRLWLRTWRKLRTHSFARAPVGPPIPRTISHLFTRSSLCLPRCYPFNFSPAPSVSKFLLSPAAGCTASLEAHTALDKHREGMQPLRPSASSFLKQGPRAHLQGGGVD